MLNAALQHPDSRRSIGPVFHRWAVGGRIHAMSRRPSTATVTATPELPPEPAISCPSWTIPGVAGLGFNARQSLPLARSRSPPVLLGEEPSPEALMVRTPGSRPWKTTAALDLPGHLF
jgi:hypothetical protein